MEEPHVPSTSSHSLNLSTNSSEETVSPNALASMRSLIVNPSTPESTISSIFETLTRSLQLSTNKLVLRHILKLLYDLASHHSSLSRLVFDSVRSHSLLSTESARLAVEALDVLASIAEHDRAALVPAMDELDEGFFASLCFSPSASLRPWLLRNAERLHVRPYLLFTVFLGFTKDPYPYVRKVALDGLVGLSKNGVIEDRGMIRGCYFRAVELLTDMEDCVRSAAVRTVCAWGQVLVASNPETKVYCSDDVFVKLCSMARDMSMEVRVEAFNALGKIEMVSEYILLQTLSKKVLGSKENICLGQYYTEQFEKLASDAAGALVHGLEDEFHEVRKSACHSLRTLTVLSAKFSVEVLNLLMDVLNDDSMVVRLEALETVHHMATADCLEVQETHMHMLLGSLVDKNSTIRSATRKILILVKLPVFKLFKLTVDALLENLETYPQDEADAFSILFHIGRNHGRFVLCIIEEISQQIEPTSESKLSFDSARVAGLLVLAISAPVLHDCNIPPIIFAYAVTFLGRISHALRDVMSQNTLLAYLSQRSRSTGLPTVEFREGHPCLWSSKSDVPENSSNENFGSFPMELQEKRDGTSKMQSPIMKESRKLATPLVEYQLEVHDEVIDSMNAILVKVKDLWPFVQSGHVNRVLRTLRGCKEELATFTSKTLAPAGVLIFTLLYLKTIEVLVKVWEQFLPQKFLHSSRMVTLDLLFGKLDRRLRELRTRFIGLSPEEELHILELMLVTCMLKLSKVEICCKLVTLRKLSSTISQVESLLKEGSVEPSNFVIKIGNLSSEIHSFVVDGSSNPFPFKRLLEFFSLKEFVFCGALKHIKAEIDVPDNNLENPISFVSGLPVGIPCQITLHNILKESRLWLKMRMDDESTQFVSLDSSIFDGCHEVRRFTFLAPFYRTPKSISFTVRLCLGVECLYEDVQFVKSCWGPKHELTYLCQEKEVYFSMVG
ncbi:protein SIEL isoform X1 [Ziziphus jujuba]|uniref:Protein SIEL isoform X1 n=1 Tax=Ziziphus jujuba TaxID=326968 RepID=A0ABM4ABQ4_ZIZJJ|nr:protein SIEL isoform X1 [Ziziphus jujuba]